MVNGAAAAASRKRHGVTIGMKTSVLTRIVGKDVLGTFDNELVEGQLGKIFALLVVFALHVKLHLRIVVTAIVAAAASFATNIGNTVVGTNVGFLVVLVFAILEIEAALVVLAIQDKRRDTVVIKAISRRSGTVGRRRLFTISTATTTASSQSRRPIVQHESILRLECIIVESNSSCFRGIFGSS
jgi:hypothetical protein